MARKTFVPHLLYLLHRVCVYIIRYRETIIQFIPEGGAALLDAVLLACQEFVDFVDHPANP